MEVNKCVLVIKQTALSQSTRAAHFARQGDATAHRLIRAATEHERTIRDTRRALEKLKINFVEIILSKMTPKVKQQLAEADLVITVGGDGTVLNSSHYVRQGAILGVNSAPLDSIGHFCSARRHDVAERLNQILRSELRPVKLSRLAVWLDDVMLPELALNDVLIAHESPAITTRYLIEYNGCHEEHRSSGLWISTAAGSTAGIRSAGGRVMPLRSRRIQYLIRELYKEAGKDYRLVRGIIEPGEELIIASKMPEGKLYIDGARTTYDFLFGMRARIKLAECDLRIFLREPVRQ